MMRLWMSSSAVAAIAWSMASTAQAQTGANDQASMPVASVSAGRLAAEPVAGQPVGGDTVQPTAIPPQPATGASGVADIVVTAQRRSESLQKASLSIAAISSQALVTRGVVDSQSLNNVVPGLALSYTAGQVQVFIRGIGDPATNPYTQASVTLNEDGIYIARSSAFGPLFFDTARVEVLRGPQGTLYGRNATGGAINVISNAPSFDGFSGYVSAEAGNYDLVRGQLAVNIPITANLAIRAAGQITHRNGYLSDGSNDDKSQAGRLRALWKPASNLSISLIGEIANIGGEGVNRVFRPNPCGDARIGPQDPCFNPTNFPNLRLRYPSNNRIRSRSISGELNWDLGGVTLNVLPAYRYNKTHYFAGTDYLLTDFDTSKQKSFEARLSGNNSGLKWVVGGYYFKEDLAVDVFTDQRVAQTLSGLVQYQNFPQFDTQAAAAFGELTYSVTDRLRAIGGLRYTDEKRLREGALTSYNYLNGVAGTPSVVPLDQSFKEHAITWRGGAEYDVSARNMLYATASKGFKSGGFDATDADTYGPEYVTAFTIGAKNRFIDNKLVLNLEGFYWKYKGQQVSFLGFDSSGTTSYITRNAGKSTLYGLSIDATWRATRVDTIVAGGEYNHTKYDNFVYATLGSAPAGALISDGCTSDGPNTAQPGTYLENCSGKALQRAPRWSGNVRYTHDFDLASGARLTAGLTGKGQSKSYLSINYLDPYFAQATYGLLDADLTYTAASNLWSLQLYAQNLTDKVFYTQASASVSIPPTSGVLRTASAAIGNPRTYGARLRYNF